MSIFRLQLLVLLFISLTGCKVELITQVKESYFEEGKGNNLGSAIRAEVSACQDYEDSKKESNSLVKAKEMIPKIFKGAVYVECNRKGMDSWAVFKINIAIFRGKPVGDNIAIYRTKEDFIGFYFPELLDLKMKEVSAKEYVKFKPSFIVNYVNDTDKSVNVIVDNLYFEKEGVEELPYLDQLVTVKPNESVYVRSSEILIKYLRRNESRGAIRYSLD